MGNLPQFSLEVLIDDAFSKVCSDALITPINNKSIVSIINNFEDKKWRYGNFQNFIWDNIADTALSSQERAKLVNQSHTSLVEAAKKLRLTDKAADDPGTGSELAEILLYGIMRHHYGSLPVVPKIFYKQNVNDNAKGADSVHIVISNNDFSLWLGEAKFYNNIEDVRLPKIAVSVSDLLQTEKLKKENSIITSVSDIDDLVSDISLRTSIKALLTHQASVDALKSKLHVPILLLHECQITRQQESLSDEYKIAIVKYHRERAQAYFKKQIEKCGSIHKYSEIKFHIILFPVPDKSMVVEKFVDTAQSYINSARDS